jgi:hypothetical protein
MVAGPFIVRLAGGRDGSPLEPSVARPPEASAHRHWFADIRDTRNRRATCQSLAPASISSAALTAPAPGGPAPRRPARQHRDSSCL